MIFQWGGTCMSKRSEPAQRVAWTRPSFHRPSWPVLFPFERLLQMPLFGKQHDFISFLLGCQEDNLICKNCLFPCTCKSYVLSLGYHSESIVCLSVTLCMLALESTPGIRESNLNLQHVFLLALYLLQVQGYQIMKCSSSRPISHFLHLHPL